MQVFKYVFSLIICFGVISTHAQKKSFELSNPNSIPLDNESLKTLTSGYWRVYKDELKSREKVASTPKNVSICYYPNGTFIYNGSTGTWKVLEDRYIEHRLDDKEAEGRLNFGGIFSITELEDSALTLTKLMTTSHDMKRTLYLKSSTILTMREQPSSQGPYFYDGALDEFTIDSLSQMSYDELFNAGFSILNNNRIHIMAQDSLYIIKLKNN